MITLFKGLYTGCCAKEWSCWTKLFEGQSLVPKAKILYNYLLTCSSLRAAVTVSSSAFALSEK